MALHSTIMLDVSNSKRSFIRRSFSKLSLRRRSIGISSPLSFTDNYYNGNDTSSDMRYSYFSDTLFPQSSGDDDESPLTPATPDILRDGQQPGKSLLTVQRDLETPNDITVVEPEHMALNHTDLQTRTNQNKATTLPIASSNRIVSLSRIEDSQLTPLITCQTEEDQVNSDTGNQEIGDHSEELYQPNQSNTVLTKGIGTSIAGSVAPIPQVKQPKSLDPVEHVKDEIKALEGGDAVFTVVMDTVLSKMVKALYNRDCAYLFRDFAGNFTTFLDRFGPGGYDSHRAPLNPQWMFKLILPWTYIEASASKVRIAIYEEINDWLRNIALYLGSRCAKEIMQEGTWDSCVEGMANSNILISDIAYGTAKKIIASLPLNRDIVYKVLLMRIASFDYDGNDMFMFRNYHTKLLNKVVERIDDTKNRQNVDEYSFHLAEIVNEFERSLNLEMNSHIYSSIEQCLEYSKCVYKVMDTLKIELPGVTLPDIKPMHTSKTSPRRRSFGIKSIGRSVQETASTVTPSENRPATHKIGYWHILGKHLCHAFSRNRDRKSTKDTTSSTMSSHRKLLTDRNSFSSRIYRSISNQHRRWRQESSIYNSTSALDFDAYDEPALRDFSASEFFLDWDDSLPSNKVKIDGY